MKTKVKLTIVGDCHLPPMPCICKDCQWKASIGSDYCYYHCLLAKQNPEQYPTSTPKEN